jgi:diguanylate cyclase (GGDEF)-like protein/PAS domain S-box-containing protein
LLHALADYQRTENGDAPMLRVALTDITQRRQAEEELRIAAIAFESQEGMMVADAYGIIIRVNHAFTTLTGYSAQEAVGKTPALLRSDRHDQSFYDAMWQTLRDKRYWQGEIWNRHKSGKLCAVWFTVTAVTTPDGGVSHYVGSFSDITQNKLAAEENFQLAYFDPLTHLANRRRLLDRLGQALTSAAETGRLGAILFLDLDNFKTLNDTRGHDIGDLLLIEVAQRMGDSVRTGDTLARLGGDEFVVLLENLSAHNGEAAALANQVGQKLLHSLGQPYQLKGFEYHGTVSMGVALFRAGDSIEALLKHADLALYQAKSSGRNTLRFFDPAMQAALDARTALESDLRQALARRELLLYFQPQIDHKGQVIGAEALIRWQHPQRGLVLPDEFVSLAEDCGLIVPIGLWVLDSACAQLNTWQSDPGTAALQVAVNVSARQFRQADFVDQVRVILHRCGARPEKLKLELTEGLVLANVSDAITKMKALKDLGVGFSMDDFGTGFSSLSYLAQLPLDQLKIDRSFVRDLPGSHSNEIITQTIVTMGQSLGLNVIAEGVETAAQHAFLQQHGCPAYQGYWFSRPLPPVEFAQFLRRAPKPG